MDECLLLRKPLFAGECVNLPLSKSMAARALVISYLSGSNPDALALPAADDTRELAEALERLGALSEKPGLCLAGFDLGLGATSLRFFLPVAASVSGSEMLIDCGEGLRRRPVAVLVEALNELGGSVEYAAEPGHPPLLLQGGGIEGGDLSIRGDISSQFISALLLAAPIWPRGLRLNVTGTFLSRPYVEMTVRMMKKAGAKVDSHDHFIQVYPGGYSQPHSVPECESDWSAASYFYEMALVHPDREITISSLCPPEESLQGDSSCAEIYRSLGVRTFFNADGSATIVGDSKEIAGLAQTRSGFVLNAGSIPDLVPSLCVGMALAGIPYRIEGVPHLRVKESDRISVLCRGLRSLGYEMSEGADYIEWCGFRNDLAEAVKERKVEIDPHGDHRMVMAFAIAAGLVAELKIKHPGCVSKSFPDFWQQVMVQD